MTPEELTELFSPFGGRDPFMRAGAHAYINVDSDKAADVLTTGVEWRGQRLNCRLLAKGSTFSTAYPVRRK